MTINTPVERPENKPQYSINTSSLPKYINDQIISTHRLGMITFAAAAASSVIISFTASPVIASSAMVLTLALVAKTVLSHLGAKRDITRRESAIKELWDSLEKPGGLDLRLLRGNKNLRCEDLTTAQKRLFVVNDFKTLSVLEILRKYHRVPPTGDFGATICGLKNVVDYSETAEADLKLSIRSCLTAFGLQVIIEIAQGLKSSDWISALQDLNRELMRDLIRPNLYDNLVKIDDHLVEQKRAFAVQIFNKMMKIEKKNPGTSFELVVEAGRLQFKDFLTDGNKGILGFIPSFETNPEIHSFVVDKIRNYILTREPGQDNKTLLQVSTNLTVDQIDVII